MKISLGFDSNLRIPWSMVATVVGIFAVTIYLLLVFFQVIETYSILLWVETFIFTWMFVVVFAILGGIFVGMFIATRSLSAKGLTPFEASMLHMLEEVRQLTNQVRQLNTTVEGLEGGPGKEQSEKPEAENQSENSGA